jgi:serine/threonine protein phosphatase 1
VCNKKKELTQSYTEKTQSYTELIADIMNRLFAISDIHGCFKPFYELVVNVIKLRKSDRLILLGDYIDRGEQSKEVVDFIMELQKGGFNVTPLIGNHEVMLINTWTDPDILPFWLMNNGMPTLQSFGIEDIRDLGNQYFRFFNSLDYYLILGNTIFVHAGFNDLADDPFSDKQTMIWECSLSYKNPVLSSKTIIHGHRPKTIPYVKKLISLKSNVIPIDTGCVYGTERGYGFLSAIEINSMTLFSTPNK